MKARLWFGVAALALLAGGSADAGIVKAVMSVTGAEMK
jgi:hypothetical protein